MIIPILPNEAELEVKAAEATGQVVFHRVVSPLGIVACRNCADEGIVYLAFCDARPLKTATGAGLWHEGDLRAKKGWYLRQRTGAYRCPVCSGQKKAPKPPVPVTEEMPF